MRPDLSAFCSLADEELLRMPNATETVLDEKEAQKRLKRYGANLLKPSKNLRCSDLGSYIASAELVKKIFNRINIS